MRTGCETISGALPATPLALGAGPAEAGKDRFIAGPSGGPPSLDPRVRWTPDGDHVCRDVDVYRRPTTNERLFLDHTHRKD